MREQIEYPHLYLRSWWEVQRDSLPFSTFSSVMDEPLSRLSSFKSLERKERPEYINEEGPEEILRFLVGFLNSYAKELMENQIQSSQWQKANLIYDRLQWVFQILLLLQARGNPQWKNIKSTKDSNCIYNFSYIIFSMLSQMILYRNRLHYIWHMSYYSQEF